MARPDHGSDLNNASVHKGLGGHLRRVIRVESVLLQPRSALICQALGSKLRLEFLLQSRYLLQGGLFSLKYHLYFFSRGSFAISRRLRFFARFEGEALRCLVAGAAESPAEPGFAEWARVRYAAYLEGRDAGRVALDDQGVALIKLLALGKGTFFDYERIREAGYRFRALVGRSDLLESPE